MSVADDDPQRDERGSRLPETGAGFFWQTEPFPVLRPATSSVTAVYTTRIGGSSTGPFASLNLSYAVGDREDVVRANRAVAGRSVGRSGRWSVTTQVHGADVHRAAPGTLREGDALWTDSHADPGGDTLAVLSADCVLVLFAGDRRIGVAHAGWRGLVAGVVEAAAAETAAVEIFAGPAIGPCCYEVGPEVIDAFERRYPQAVTDARHVDLWAATEAAAAAAGVATVHAARICTSCRSDLFFSHRRDAGRTGRQALIAHA